jgi:hypothetical protein
MRENYNVAQKSSNFLLEIMTLVSSAFMYIMKSKDPRTDPWGTQCFIVPQFEKKILIVIR